MLLGDTQQQKCPKQSSHTSIPDRVGNLHTTLKTIGKTNWNILPEENLLLVGIFGGARIICFYPCNYSFWRQKAAFSAENKACVALFVTRVLCTTTITTAAPNSRLVALEGYHHQHHPRSVKKPFLISTILYVSLSFLRLPLTQCHVTPHETSFTFRTPFKIKASLTSMTFAPFGGDKPRKQDNHEATAARNLIYIHATITLQKRNTYIKY